MSSPNVTLPNEVIVGIASNTAHYGYAPIGVQGPVFNNPSFEDQGGCVSFVEANH